MLHIDSRNFKVKPTDKDMTVKQIAASLTGGRGSRSGTSGSTNDSNTESQEAFGG